MSDRIVFLPGKDTPTAPVLSTIAGTTTTAQTLFFFYSLQSRGGFSYSSTSASISLNAGEGVQIDVDVNFVNDFLTSASDWHRLVISASDTNDAATASVLADIDLQSGGVYVGVIPSVSLTSDDHFERNRTVADYASLPSSGMVQGALGEVTGDRVYRWDGSSWNPYEVNRKSVYVVDINIDIGAFRGMARSPGFDDAIIPIASLPLDGALSEGIKIAAFRDSSTITDGTWIRLQLEVGNTGSFDGRSWNYLFSNAGVRSVGKLKYLGKTDRVNWVLNTGAATEVDYGIDEPVFQLPEAISATEAAVFEWQFSIDAAQVLPSFEEFVNLNFGFRLTIEKQLESAATAGDRYWQKIFSSEAELQARSREGLIDRSVAGYPSGSSLVLFQWDSLATDTPVAGQILQLNDGGDGRYKRIALSPDWGGVAEFVNIRTISGLSHGKVWHVLDFGLVSYDETLGNADDGLNYFLPDSIDANDNGRLIPVPNPLAANKAIWGDAVADTTALAALTDPIDGQFYPVGDKIYIKSSTTIPGNSPRVVIPTATGITGSYLAIADNGFVDTATPANAPDALNLIWIAELSTPTRKIVYFSRGTSLASDWQAIATEGILTDTPANLTFTPDYAGQEIWQDNGALWFSGDGVNWIEVSGSGGGGGGIQAIRDISINHNLALENKNELLRITASGISLTLPGGDLSGTLTAPFETWAYTDYASGDFTIQGSNYMNGASDPIIIAPHTLVKITCFRVFDDGFGAVSYWSVDYPTEIPDYLLQLIEPTLRTNSTFPGADQKGKQIRWDPSGAITLPTDTATYPQGWNVEIFADDPIEFTGTINESSRGTISNLYVQQGNFCQLTQIESSNPAKWHAEVIEKPTVFYDGELNPTALHHNGMIAIADTNTLNLPGASFIEPGYCLRILCKPTGTATATLNRNGSNINGSAANYSLTESQGWVVAIYSASGWWIG